MAECPESIEELEALEQLLPLCKRTLYETAKAKVESGAARSRLGAAKQIADETGRPVETIRRAIYRHEDTEKTVTLSQPENVFKLPICSLHTGDQESYTPGKYIESARLVMGSIDLDPASNELAQKNVRAKTYYTKQDNGLEKPWTGNIFLNPPYSHPDIKYFVDKLLSELKPGQQAVLLTNNNTDTNFFHDAAKSAAAVCFTKGRINFLKADGSTSSPTNGQTFFYFGENKREFIKEFSQYGLIMELADIGLSQDY
jgi:phage N-6-adenine-methyltransferase